MNLIYLSIFIMISFVKRSNSFISIYPIRLLKPYCTSNARALARNLPQATSIPKLTSDTSTVVYSDTISDSTPKITYSAFNKLGLLPDLVEAVSVQGFLCVNQCSHSC